MQWQSWWYLESLNWKKFQGFEKGFFTFDWWTERSLKMYLWWLWDLKRDCFWRQMCLSPFGLFMNATGCLCIKCEETKAKRLVRYDLLLQNKEPIKKKYVSMVARTKLLARVIFSVSERPKRSLCNNNRNCCETELYIYFF